MTLLVHVDTLFPDTPVNNSTTGSPRTPSKPTTPRSGKPSFFDEDLTEKQLPPSPTKKSISVSDLNKMYSNGSQQNRMTAFKSSVEYPSDKTPLARKPSNGTYSIQSTSVSRKTSAQRETSVYSTSRYDSQATMPELPPRKSSVEYDLPPRKSSVEYLPPRKASIDYESSPRKAETDFYSKPLSLPKTLHEEKFVEEPKPVSNRNGQGFYRPISVDDYLDLFESPTSPSTASPRPLPLVSSLSPSTTTDSPRPLHLLPSLSLDFVGLPPVLIDSSPLLDFKSLDVKFDKFLSSDDED